jgi:predicted house-cleaning noncanonical NTP pyrophosphatase (MazG superfamily)
MTRDWDDPNNLQKYIAEFKENHPKLDLADYLDTVSHELGAQEFHQKEIYCLPDRDAYHIARLAVMQLIQDLKKP